jgi:hypothetical protein
MRRAEGVMSAGDRPVSKLEGAMLLMTALEERGWIFGLDRDGRLTLVIGDPQPGTSQENGLTVLRLRGPEGEQILGAAQRGPH